MKSARTWAASALSALVALSLLALPVLAQDPRCETRPQHPICAEPTTTTAPSTTTTEPTTTTTEPPTTTTTAPPSGELVIPPTQYQTISGFKENESFRIEMSCIDFEDVVCELDANGGRSIGSFDYLAHGMPYTYSEAQPGMHQHAWWVAGDREGYKCAYGFMYDQHPNPFGMFDEPRPAEFIARFSVVRPVDYGKVNDKYMEEGVRYYDGELAFEGGNEIKDPTKASDCEAEALEPDFDYDAYVPHGPDDIRVGLFRGDGEIADIRDFTDVELAVEGHFEFVSLVDGRAQIVFVLGVTNKVSHVIYYDTMNTGLIAVEVNGVTVTHQDPPQ